MKAAKMDYMMHQLIMTQLIMMQAVEPKVLVLPDTLRRQVVSPENFARLRDAYAGLTPDNLEEVR